MFIALVSRFLTLRRMMTALGAVTVWLLSGVPAWSAPIVTIAVHAGSPGLAIPRDFPGFSFETGSLTSAMSFPAESTVFRRMISQLGPGMLRFGGNSVDRTGWARCVRTAETPTGILTSSDADRVFSLARATGWKILWSVNLGTSKPGIAADEADYVEHGAGGSLYGFEIGNEPDLFPNGRLRPRTYSVQDFIAEWRSYADTIQSSVPRAVLTGPAAAKHIDDWTAPFARQVGSLLALLTQHMYPMRPASLVGPDAPNAPSIHNMLSEATREREDAEGFEVEKIAQAAGIPWRMAETNSCSHGGSKGVSNTFASALWGLDYMFTLARHAAAGVNFHAGRTSVYTPITWAGDRFTARPLYYAMLMFHAAAQGRLVPLDMETSGVNLTAYAVLGNDGTLRLTVINKDAARDATLQIRPGSGYTTASAMRLTGPKLDATRGTTLGGAAVQADGGWSPEKRETIVSRQGVLTTTIPAGSAVLLSFQKSA